MLRRAAGSVFHPLLALCVGLFAYEAMAAKAALRVLFVGNSQMITYDLPQMVATLSEAAPEEHPRLEIGRCTVGGTSLKSHWEAGEGPGTARGLIAGEKWDLVILQEIFNATPEGFEKYAEYFEELVRRSGPKLLLFATANVTASYGASYQTYLYPDAFKKLNGMQIDFGKKKNVAVAAAGLAWMKFLGPNPSQEALLDLYHKDKGHPGAKGTYIYACLLYAHITGRSPIGLPCEFPRIREGISIPSEEASRLQKTAWEQFAIDKTRE